MKETTQGSMGGDSFVSDGTDEGFCLVENFPMLSSQAPPVLRDNLDLQDEDNIMKVDNGLACSEIGEESTQFSSGVNFQVNRRSVSMYKEILQCCELDIHRNDLKREKQKILSYRPGAWIEQVGGLKSCDYDIPKTTCLLLVGPSGSGKSSLINRISKVFEDDKFAPARAQESYNSLIGDGTYFLQEYMIPRDSNSICLYDTRSLLDNSHKDENIRMLESWMTKGVQHGELVPRNTDNKILRESLKLKGKAYKKGYCSSDTRKVNFVIYVVNGLSVLKAMENAGALETEYIETVVSTFNCPFVSFKDDKPVLVFTHGDLLSPSDRALICAHLGSLLGIPPTKQIFDIPDCDCPATESAIIGMLRYSLVHADRNFPQKRKVMDKIIFDSFRLIRLDIIPSVLVVRKISLSLCMILLILGIGVAMDLAENRKDVARLKLKAPRSSPIEWHKIRHIW
ncbi:hypothetical protein Fmac_011231 [Flemingia macrophylla]|uniref:Uncharacterized protein n=1 Tax=Flemingia macrophylla TaxID=520843 RepID=A0ABD1MNZ4_9FABA